LATQISGLSGGEQWQIRGRAVVSNRLASVRRRLLHPVLVGCWLVAAALAAVPAQARQTAAAEHEAVALQALPAQAQRTQRLIQAGGPFPYPKDGVVFGNRERQLPRHERGFYREYTVPTAGSQNRGAQRIVCGGNLPRQPEVCYYTADHYASFQRIAP
jgi:ribonuclease T1